MGKVWGSIHTVPIAAILYGILLDQGYFGIDEQV